MEGFWDILEKRQKLKKSLDTIDARDREDYAPNKQFKNYEFNLSHTRSLARISSATSKQYFQGSSLLRKKNTGNKPPELLEPAEALDQSFFKREQKFIINKIRNVEKLHKKQHMEARGMSRRTRIKIKEKMMAVYSASKSNFTLQTLTLVAPATDYAAIKCLNKYLTVLRKQNGLFNYVWVAERQDGKRNKYQSATGNLHFHIIMDRRIPIEYINSLWVCQQHNSKIINEEAALKFKNDYGLTFKQAHKKGCEAGSDWHSIIQKYLNPVDVDKVKNIDGMSAYLTNYVIKNETKASCAIWHCNRNVSKLFTKQLISKKTFEKTCGNCNRTWNKKGKRQYVNKPFVHQYGIINNIYNKKYFSTFLKEMDLLNSWILKNEKIDCGVKISFDNYNQILYGVDEDTGEMQTWSIKKYQTKAEVLYNAKEYFEITGKDYFEIKNKKNVQLQLGRNSKQKTMVKIIKAQNN